jgi:hypothetical protein
MSYYDDLTELIYDTPLAGNQIELKKQVEELNKNDIGYNKIWRMIERGDRLKRTKIDIYASNGIGCHIRDAETGAYYNYLVGSSDEHLFFKTALATGECNSKNGSNTLFYNSPQHYMSHLNAKLSDNIISEWETKRLSRLAEIDEHKKSVSKYINVH